MSTSFEEKRIVSKAKNDNSKGFRSSYNGSPAPGPRGTIAQKAQAYLHAVDMSIHSHDKKEVTKMEEKNHVPRLQSLTRISHIPIVETGLGIGNKVYYTIKESNPLIRWSLTTAEASVAAGMQRALPAVTMLEAPLTRIDGLLCATLDQLEKRVPSITLPPQDMYVATRKYVMRRADSVKQIGTAVLDSRVTAATAVALDRALTTADKYVDKILPPDNQDAVDGPGEAPALAAEAQGGQGGRARAAQAVQHGARFKRKLQRRLTRQALAEARAIKEQIHVLVYVAELVATDPALAWQKARELYLALSGPEPENQARPATVEELIVLISRESARKLVHVINYTHRDLPNDVKGALSIITSHLASTADTILKKVHLEQAKSSAMGELRQLRARIDYLLHELKALTKTYLEQLAMFVAGNEREKLPSSRNNHFTNAMRDAVCAINGVN